MNIPTLICAILVTSLLPSVGDIPWTYSIEEGEDASSSHYYFYQERHESIERIRWVWNGGAQNAPTVTDYILMSGKEHGAPPCWEARVSPKTNQRRGCRTGIGRRVCQLNL